MSDYHAENEERMPIVALCASAGGLEAYQTFFDAMPAESGVAFVVIQHLALRQESILGDLIKRHTLIPVHVIVNDMRVDSDNIYVLPPGFEVEIVNGHFHLSELKHLNGWPKTIDRFLQSLAVDRGERAVAVIFSGAGTDSVVGVETIHKNGGLVLVQDVNTAIQPHLPANVINAGYAHAILPPDHMPEALLRHFGISLPMTIPFEDLTQSISDEDILRITTRLQRQTDRNFTDYKTSTLRRQIARRMGIHQLQTVDAYLEYMNTHLSESTALGKYLLINVTGFFRDSEAFASLKLNALLPFFKDFDIDTVFRVWIPGCASGEEAISIAILIHECMQELNILGLEVRIFATDLNRDLIKQARSGFYPRNTEDGISPARLQAHFVEEKDGYRIRNHISRMIIWSEHNLVENPPFSNLHLISCRNVLIYFQRRLQDRVMALFQFALVSGGLLFLGTSETMPYNLNTFIAIDSKYKIYRVATAGKRAWMKLDHPLFIKVPEFSEATMPELPSFTGRDREDHEMEIIKRMLMDHYRSTCAIVDEHYRVKYTYGEIDRYLGTVPGRDGQHNVLERARPGLDVELTIALHQVFETNEETTRERVWVKTNGHERIINLIVRPIEENLDQGKQVLIIFELALKGEHLKTGIANSSNNDEAPPPQFREELQQTQKALKNVTQALQAKSEELTSSMEEIRSANEEVQTTNEELRTSKEELESMNEELNTLNTQLTDQNYELTRANNTLHNFLQSSEIGMIFLDKDLGVREYTFAVTDLFGLRPGDTGRPLIEIASKLNYAQLIADAQSVLNTLINVEREVEALNGRWYSLAIRPYRTTNNVIDGLVLTFSDITSQKNTIAQVELHARYVRQVVETIDNILIELDSGLRVVEANQLFYDKFLVNPEITKGQLLYELGNGQWDIPELRHLLTEVIPAQTVVHNFAVTHNFPNLGLRTMRLNARQISELDRILLVITDVSKIDEP
ncbi:MAG: CheR family methyltransferase [Aggregatilineales bacterium]